MKTVQTVSKRPLFDAAPTGRRGICIRSGACCIAAAHVPIRTAEVLKLRVLVSLQGNSNFAVSLTNVGEKNVKGLLFRKQPRTVEFRLYEIDKAIQTLLSAYQT